LVELRYVHIINMPSDTEYYGKSFLLQKKDFKECYCNVTNEQLMQLVSDSCIFKYEWWQVI